MRVSAASSRKLRKLSGWNVFQRERLDGLGAMDPAEYKAQVAALSRQWGDLPEDDKQAYTVQAEYEEQIRTQVREEPLSAKAIPAPSDEGQVGKRALKKLSAVRLQKNFQEVEKHPAWTWPSQLGDSPPAPFSQSVS